MRLVANPWIRAVSLVVLTCVVYLPAVRCGFVWDDDELVTQNRLIRMPDGLYRFWFTTQAPDYWPLTSTSWWLEWRLWGTHPSGYHAVNILLHALSAMLWWRILIRLRIPGAWLAAAVFAVHPVNVESVAWIAERKNTLAMCFFSVTCLCYLKFDDSSLRRWYWISLGAFALALLSKTAVAAFPAMILIIGWWRRGRIQRQEVMRSLPYFLVAAILGLVTVWFQYHRAIGHDVVRQDSIGSRLAGAGWAVWFYLYKALLPVDLQFVYPRWRINPNDLLSYVPGLLLLASFVLFWRHRARWGKPCLLAFGYYVIMLVPALGFINIYFMRFSLVADHWQYYSIIGVIGLVVSVGTTIAERSGSKGQLMGVLAAATALTLLGVATWNQQRMYMDLETLWRTTLSRNPECWLAHNNLGTILQEQGKPEQAQTEFQVALRLNPDYADARNNLGTILVMQGDTGKAAEEFETAIRLKPSFADAHENMAKLLMESGHPAQAAAEYEAVLSITPESAEIHNDLGTVFAGLGKLDQAIEQYRRALQINPAMSDTHYNLAVALMAQSRVAEAITEYEIVIHLKPDPVTYNSLAIALLQSGRPTEAEQNYRLALRMQPDDPQVHYNLANVLAQEGKRQEAAAQYAEALKLQPDFTAASVALTRLKTGAESKANGQ